LFIVLFWISFAVPFLDKDFLDVAMNIDPREKMCTKDRIEKWILRKAFDTPGSISFKISFFFVLLKKSISKRRTDVFSIDSENPYLPQSILWRQKEQFSDGVGYSWIDCM
jgi:asparagine synthase (glutamine-hydrolysing)